MRRGKSQRDEQPYLVNLPLESSGELLAILTINSRVQPAMTALTSPIY
jgi:hypothetical protein